MKIQLPDAVRELLKAHADQQTALLAQIDQLRASVRELEAWVQMSEDLKGDEDDRY